MANSSSVVAVKTALLTTLQAAVTDLQGGGKVTYGHPSKNLMRENVWLGNPRFESEEVAGLRSTPRAHNEAYVVPVVIWILARGDDAQVCEARWFEIAAEVENVIRTQPDLDGTVPGLHWARVAGKEPNAWVDDGARGYEGVVLVNVMART